MPYITHTARSRALGIIVGATLAIAVLVAAKPDAKELPLAASVQVSLPVSGELETTPAAPDPALSAELGPDTNPAASDFRLRNQTGEPLAVVLKARADSTALDGLLQLRLTSGGQELAETTLQGLRRGAAPLVIPSGAERTVRLSAWIAPEVETGYEGRAVAISLVPTIGGGG